MNKLMKKTAIMILLLLAAAVLFASCEGRGGDVTSETGEVSTAPSVIDIDLSEYAIVRATRAGENAITKIVAFRKALIEKIGTSVDIKEDWAKNNELSAADLEAKEILIGNTNRPQTETALSNINNGEACYVIAVIENKIVIAASTDDLLGDALEYFLSTVSGKTISLPSDYLYLSEAVPVLNIVDAGKSTFKVVYKDGLDAKVTSGNDKDKVDLEVQCCKDIRDTIKTSSGVNLDLATDWRKSDEDKSAEKEILVGYNIDRPETKQFLSSIAYDEYGFAVIGNKVVVAGWNLTTLDAAASMFKTFVSGSATGKTGEKTLSLISGFRSVKKQADWYIDFPQFTAGTLEGTYDARDNCLEFLYSGVSENDYKSYVESLKSAGFKSVMKNDIVGNLSETLTGTDGMLHVIYVPKDSNVRIISCPKGKYNLPATVTEADVPAFTKITSPKITQMGLNYNAGNFGMCYIITLSDGSFVVFDGGGYNSEYGDALRLYNLLKSLNKRTDGKIVIAGWFLTHEHWDHATNFFNSMKDHGTGMVLEACYMNMPAKSAVTNSNNPNYYVDSNFATLSMTVEGGTKIVKLHTGMKFMIRDAEFEILATHEDNFPRRCNYFNETTTVTRMKLGGNSVMWLGDAKNYASSVITTRYGSYVKSDIVQVAHHGYDGINQSAYRLMDPQILLWPTSQSNWSSQITGKTYAVDKYLYELVGEANIIVAQDTSTITLPFKRGDSVVKEAY